MHIADRLSLKMGKGNIITRGCSFSVDIKIGDFNQFNSLSALAHDDVVGSFNVFMPLTRVSGEVSIGRYNSFGIGTIILQNIKIGNKVRVAPNSVVMRKTKDNVSTWVIQLKNNSIKIYMAIFNYNNIKISGMTCVIPKNVVKTSSYKDIFGNDEVEKFINMTGISETRRTKEFQTASDMATTAARHLLKMKNVDPSEIKALVFGTHSPDYKRPASAFVIQKQLEFQRKLVFLISV